MFTSPDLLAFTKEDELREAPSDQCAVPDELSVPLFPYSGDATPWSKTSSTKFHKDFILVSEFSEQVGPQPLLTIPPGAKACGSFDLNNFSLRIMSVDYQASSSSPGGCSNPKLNFIEDSKVVLADSKDGAYAYVHYLTLYDLEARGFVRPLCLAYVSSDEGKIMQQFPRLCVEFSKASECLKTGNRKNFANELEKKLRDLEYTRTILLKELEEDSFKGRAESQGEGEDLTVNNKSVLERKKEEEKQSNGSCAIREEEETKNTMGLSGALDPGKTENTSALERENALNITTDLLGEGEEGRERDGSKLSNMREEGKKTGPEDEKQNMGCPAVQSAKRGDELVCVDKAIREHKGLLRQVTSYPNRKLKDPEFLPYESDDSSHSFEVNILSQGPEAQFHSLSNDFTSISLFSHTPQVVSCTASKRFDKQLKTLQELCDEYFHEQALEQLRSIEKHFRGDACHLHVRQLCQSLLQNLKTTNFLFEDPCDVEEEEDYTGMLFDRGGAKPVCPSLSLPSSPITNEPLSLESYHSCVEMVPIKLEIGQSSRSTKRSDSEPTSPLSDQVVTFYPANENEAEDEELSVAVMKSSVSSGESIEVLGTERSFRNHASMVNIELGAVKHNHLPPQPYVPVVPVEVLRRRVMDRRAISEDSIEILSTTDSIIPEDLRASCSSVIQEETQELEENESNLVKPTSTTLSQEQSSVDQSTQEMENMILVQEGGTPGQERTGTRQEEAACAGPANTPSVVLTPPHSPVHLSQDEASIEVCPVVGLLPFSFLEEPSRIGWEDMSDRTSYVSTSASDSTVPVVHQSNGRKSRRHCSRTGRAALQFIRQFPFAGHAVFSLLSGRTVVVLGGDERTVRQVVTALSVFLPNQGRYKESIQPWISTPPQLTDLLSWKLIGFSRMSWPTSPSMPHSLGGYSRYLSILDIDQKSLRCPVYRGSLIGPLVDPRTQITRGSTYYLFAHSVLTRLVSRAFLLTFSHNLHLPNDPSIEDDRFERLLCGLHEDDKRVLHFLSELIRLRFTGAPPTILRFSYSACTLFKL
ncbi:guanine nucleotide exchange protein smcr8b [Chanos chanos]|uniref:Guanine nucleotide exchange protein smcr8b n=1 Tax=Chanos chanos TaxID=29144 RepID=A0A6J2VT55_CHACN|nr:guanine nucleotide exchange protein smcr8b-like [Chanos chanos]